MILKAYMDEKFIKLCLDLAKKGLSWTYPNPMVGAVIVKDGKVVSEGYHHKFGEPHAEVEAIKNLKEDPKDVTLYVNLEPCTNHPGKKTPSCSDLIIKTGIKKVVCAIQDPNPGVAGQGIKKMRESGIEVKVGILENEAKKLNQQFFTFQIKKRPFVALKFASSLDGKIATKNNDSKWITNEKSREFSHKLRGEYQAILVGINTILMDNPNLGTRISGLKDPLRIIIDPKLKTPEDADVLRDENVLIVTTKLASKDKITKFTQNKINILVFQEENIVIKDLLNKLYEMKILSILVEGGSNTLGHFVDSKLVDKVYAFFAPKIIGGQDALTSVGGIGVEKVEDALNLKDMEIQNFDDDFLITGYTI